MMKVQRDQPKVVFFVFAASLFFAGAVWVVAFQYLPVENTTLGLDWRTIWQGIYLGQVKFGGAENAIGGMFTPPWGILFLLPLGFLSFRASWGVLSFVTLVALIMSVPRLPNGKPDFLGIVLLCLSFPALRNLADGNLEGLIVGGIVCLLWGYHSFNSWLLSLGFLFALIKFQETWLLGLVLIYLTWKNWPAQPQRLAFGLLLILLTISFVLWGGDWLKAILLPKDNSLELSATMGRGSLIDITLMAALGRLGLPLWLVIMSWLLLCGSTTWLVYKTRARLAGFLTLPEVGFLLAASMLLAPYVSGNSFLTILALGIIPLLQKWRWLGAALIAASNLPYLMSRDVLYFYQSYYWSFLLFILWVVLGYRCWLAPQRDIRP